MFISLLGIIQSLNSLSLSIFYLIAEHHFPLTFNLCANINLIFPVIFLTISYLNKCTLELIMPNISLTNKNEM